MLGNTCWNLGMLASNLRVPISLKEKRLANLDIWLKKASLKSMYNKRAELRKMTN